MTQIQKVIKYIAISLAIFLIVTIISMVLMGSYALFSGLGLINKNIITEDLKIISNEVLDVSSLKIDLAYTNLYIKTGEKFEVQTNNTQITFKNNNGNVEIKEKNKHFLTNINSDLIVYIPEKLLIDEINIDAGAGGVYLENVVSTSKTNIDGGVGKIELINCELNNLKADLGIGEFKFNGILTGKNEINSGIGATNIDLIGENYTIYASKGLGNIIIDNERIENDKTYGNGSNYLEVDGGIGEIKINFIN